MKEINFTKAEYIKVIAELASYIDSLDEAKSYTLTVKEKKKRRSLDANAYCWVLLDKLATALNLPKTELYKNYIKEIGGVSETVCVKNEAVNKLCECWQSKGLGWQTDTIKSKLEGCTNVILYYGSSVYDTKQMSNLIEMIVQDCKTFDIETMPAAELEKLVAEWGAV